MDWLSYGIWIFGTVGGGGLIVAAFRYAMNVARRPLEQQLSENEAALAHMKKLFSQKEEELRDLQIKLIVVERNLNEEIDKYFPYMGALLRRRPDGSIEERAYCPNCRSVMASIHSRRYTCHRCKTEAGFSDPIANIIRDCLG